MSNDKEHDAFVESAAILGAVFSEEDLIVKRCGTGFPPMSKGGTQSVVEADDFVID